MQEQAEKERQNKAAGMDPDIPEDAKNLGQATAAAMAKKRKVFSPIFLINGTYSAISFLFNLI